MKKLLLILFLALPTLAQVEDPSLSLPNRMRSVMPPFSGPVYPLTGQVVARYDILQRMWTIKGTMLGASTLWDSPTWLNDQGYNAGRLPLRVWRVRGKNICPANTFWVSAFPSNESLELVINTHQFEPGDVIMFEHTPAWSTLTFTTYEFDEQTTPATRSIYATNPLAISKLTRDPYTVSCD
jgi:hypothetical protein